MVVIIVQKLQQMIVVVSMVAWDGHRGFEKRKLLNACGGSDFLFEGRKNRQERKKV